MINKSQYPILFLFLLSLVGFTLTFIWQDNVEFIGYVVIVGVLFGLVLFSNRYVEYPNFVLWGLLAWSVLHMLGGVISPTGGVFYTLVFYPLVGEPYNILKYDQVIHTIGFFVATLVMYQVLEKYLKRPFGWWGVGIVIVMAGLGLGAVNEIVEFLMTVFVPETNVGGYVNNALDLIFNLIGAILAVVFIKFKKNLEDGGEK